MCGSDWVCNVNIEVKVKVKVKSALDRVRATTPEKYLGRYLVFS